MHRIPSFCNDTVIEIEDADGDAMVVDGIRLGFDSFVVDTEAPTVEAYVPTPPAGATGVPVTEAVVVGSARKNTTRKWEERLNSLTLWLPQHRATHRSKWCHGKCCMSCENIVGPVYIRASLLSWKVGYYRQIQVAHSRCMF